MSSRNFTYSPKDLKDIRNTDGMKVGIVVSEWNREITDALLNSCTSTLLDTGVKDANINVRYVPGSFELVAGCASLIRKTDADVVIAIGCVIRGDTPHFDYICQGVTQGIAHLNATEAAPVVFGVLTVNTMEQALERTGGAAGDKGAEFAVTAIKMADFVANS